MIKTILRVYGAFLFLIESGLHAQNIPDGIYSESFGEQTGKRYVDSDGNSAKLGMKCEKADLNIKIISINNFNTSFSVEVAKIGASVREGSLVGVFGGKLVKQEGSTVEFSESHEAINVSLFPICDSATVTLIESLGFVHCIKKTRIHPGHKIAVAFQITPVDKSENVERLQCAVTNVGDSEFTLRTENSRNGKTPDISVFQVIDRPKTKVLKTVVAGPIFANDILFVTIRPKETKLFSAPLSAYLTASSVARYNLFVCFRLQFVNSDKSHDLLWDEYCGQTINVVLSD